MNVKAVLVVLVMAIGSPWLGAEDPIRLWPDDPPGEVGPKVGPERELEAGPNQRVTRRLTDISTPTLTAYRPEKAANGTAVVIAPGGGYNILAWDLEGVEVAQWLSKLGVTAFVLKYRVPRRPGTPGFLAPPQAQQDAQRAIRWVRHHAKDYQLDPAKIGMLGFSAGGHLTAWASTNSEKPSYPLNDAIDKASCRPDFSILVYPAYLTNSKDPSQLAADLTVTAQTPPAFLAHAYDDRVSPENSIRYFLALKEAKVPAELHVYSTGGHGFGLRDDDKPVSTWPARCQEWMKAQGLLGK